MLSYWSCLSDPSWWSSTMLFLSWFLLFSDPTWWSSTMLSYWLLVMAYALMRSYLVIVEDRFSRQPHQRALPTDLGRNFVVRQSCAERKTLQIRSFRWGEGSGWLPHSRWGTGGEAKGRVGVDVQCTLIKQGDRHGEGGYSTLQQ